MLLIEPNSAQAARALAALRTRRASADRGARDVYARMFAPRRPAARGRPAAGGAEGDVTAAATVTGRPVQVDSGPE